MNLSKIIFLSTPANLDSLLLLNGLTILLNIVTTVTIIGSISVFFFIVEMASVREETDSDEYCSDEPSQADSDSSHQSLSKKKQGSVQTKVSS